MKTLKKYAWVALPILGIACIAWALYKSVFSTSKNQVVETTTTTNGNTQTQRPPKLALAAPVTPLMVRVDSAGNGHFDSSRTNHTHQGVDLRVTKGQNVRSPVDGLVERMAYPYKTDKKWKGLYIKGTEGVDAKIFYIEPIADIVGKSVKRGDVIAIAQKISDKYSPNMLDHIHFEAWVKGAAVNPEPLLGLTA